VVRDVRTLTELKVRALCAVTAVTAQTDTALLAMHAIPESVVRAQIAAAFATAAVQVVKVGMLATGATARLVAELLPLAAVVTPNLPEAALLLGLPQARDEVTALVQAQELLRRGARAVLLKGGHANGPHSVDLLLAHGASPERLSAVRVGANLRGSGCALASAIAAYLAQGVPLPAACARAKNYVTALLQRS